MADPIYTDPIYTKLLQPHARIIDAVGLKADTLTGFPNVFAVPDIRTPTRESMTRFVSIAAKRVCQHLKTGRIVGAVNFPDTSMEWDGSHRIILLHQNQVGMLGKYTSLLGEREINVLGNANTSRGEFAVTIIDTDQTVPPDLVVKLRAIEGTYAVRVIPAAA